MAKHKNNPNIDPINHPDEKRCTKCKDWHSTAEYYKDSRSSDGLASQCRLCNLKYRNKEAGKFTHIRNRPHEPEGKRWCSHCELVKDNAEFKMGRKSLRRICMECERKAGRDYVATHKEQLKQYRIDNHDYILQLSRAYYLSNKEKINAASREWRKNNPIKFRMGVERAKAKKPELYEANALLKRSRRRQRLKDLPDDYTIVDWERAVEYFNQRCAVCGQLPDKNMGMYLAADHWQPLSKSNKGTVVDNIVPLCHSGVGCNLHGAESGCNNRKAGKNPVEWITSTYDEITSEEILRRIDYYFAWATSEKNKVKAAKQAERDAIQEMINKRGKK